jgi:hypothetical protein
MEPEWKARPRNRALPRVAKGLHFLESGTSKKPWEALLNESVIMVAGKVR